MMLSTKYYKKYKDGNTPTLFRVLLTTTHHFDKAIPFKLP